MKRIALVAALVAGLALPGPTLGFHHAFMPVGACAATAAGSPSNLNGEAREQLIRLGLFPPALPPAGTPGAFKGEGGEHCANAD